MTVVAIATLLPPAGSDATPAELLFTLGTIVERHHPMALPFGLFHVAWGSFGDHLKVAEARGFTERRKLRDALRVGRITPRGRRLCEEVISFIAPDERAMLLERMRRSATYLTNPTAANLAACRAGPVFSLNRTKPDQAAAHLAPAAPTVSLA